MNARILIAATAATTALSTAHANPPITAPSLLPESLEAYRDARQDGGPGKDGIPSIDEPDFIGADEVDLDPGDRVIGVYHKGEARAYPQAILVWHEIVNDTIAGDDLAVTYCPLTGTALGFKRGDTELGVSGKLVNSNLVMYDRETDTEYPQILGAGIDGPLAGDGLEEVRVIWTQWGQWQERHPDTQVLSRDTGYLRNYDSDPYGSYNPASGYYAPKSSTIFPTLHQDDRYPNKAEILGFRDSDHAVAIDPDHLAEAGVVHDEVDGTEYLVIHDAGLGTGYVFTGEDIAVPAPEAIDFGPEGPAFAGDDALTEINAFEAMWFAWYAFYPDTAVIDG